MATLEQLREGGYGTIGNRNSQTSEIIEDVARSVVDSISTYKERHEKSERLYEQLKKALDKERLKAKD